MKLTTTLALVLTPLLVAADGWHFETSSGRADGTGSRSCQKFYMKKTENFTFKMDQMKSRSKRSAAPQGCSQRDSNEKRCGNGDWGSNNNPPNGGSNGPQGPPPQNRPPPPPNNGGQWNGPTGPPPPALKCCLKIYADDYCKDKDHESCVEDKGDKREDKGKAGKDFRSFNVACK
jgi:hypothetical protein